MTERQWLEGRISVEAALAGKKRPVERLVVEEGKNKRSLRRLLRLAENEDVTVDFKPPAFIDEFAQGKTHGGVIALVGPRQFSELSQLLDREGLSFVVMLDGVEDPFNFGQAVRSLYAAGASGLVVRKRNWLLAANIVARSSAGTSELISIAQVDSPLDAANFFREKGLLIACTARKSAVSLYEADFSKPIFLLVGGEKRGITRSFIERADLRLRIPYGREFPLSLGVAPSTAVIAFEILRNRLAAK